MAHPGNPGPALRRSLACRTLQSLTACRNGDRNRGAGLCGSGTSFKILSVQCVKLEAEEEVARGILVAGSEAGVDQHGIERLLLSALGLASAQEDMQDRG